MRKLIILSTLMIVSILSNGQNKPIKLESLTYSPNIMFGAEGDLRPFYQKAEANFLVYGKVNLKLSQGLFSATDGNNVEPIPYISQTGIVQSLAFQIVPVELNRFRFHVGLGLAGMHFKRFRTLQTKTIKTNKNYRFHYIEGGNYFKIGLTTYADFEYIVSNNFAFSLGFNFMSFKEKVTDNFDSDFIYTGLNLVYYIDNQLINKK